MKLSLTFSWTISSTESFFSLVGSDKALKQYTYDYFTLEPHRPIYLSDICKQSYHCFNFVVRLKVSGTLPVLIWSTLDDQIWPLSLPLAVTVNTLCHRLSQSTLFVIGSHSQHSLSSVVTVNTLCHRLSQSTHSAIGCHNQHSLPLAVTVNTLCHWLSQSTLSSLSCYSQHSLPLAVTVNVLCHRLSQSALSSLAVPYWQLFLALTIPYWQCTFGCPPTENYSCHWLSLTSNTLCYQLSSTGSGNSRCYWVSFTGNCLRLSSTGNMLFHSCLPTGNTVVYKTGPND